MRITLEASILAQRINTRVHIVQGWMNRENIGTVCNLMTRYPGKSHQEAMDLVCSEIWTYGRDLTTVTKRKADKPLQASKPQLPADHGLFSDESSQIDLIEMLMEPHP